MSAGEGEAWGGTDARATDRGLLQADCPSSVRTEDRSHLRTLRSGSSRAFGPWESRTVRRWDVRDKGASTVRNVQGSELRRIARA